MPLLLSELLLTCRSEESPLSDGPQNIRTYAASYWGLHYSRINELETRAAADTLLLKFAFDDEGTCFQEWLDDAKEVTLSLLPWDLRLQKLAAVQSPSRTPLIAASIYGLLSVLNSMHSRALACDRQVDYNEKNDDGASAIYLSARCGNLAILEFLIAQGGSVNTSGGRYGNPLQAAAFHGHERALQYLLDHGADPSAPGRFEDVLQAAIAGGHESSIQYLLTCEDIISTCNLKEALMSVCYAGNHSAVTALLNRDDLKQSISKPTDICTSVPPLWTCSSELNNVLAYQPICQALQLALYRGRASVARSLLAQCEDVNATGGHFGNLVQAAAFGGRETMVRWLIDRGADVYARGRYGSALRAASLGGHNAVVHLLLHHGARMDIGDDNALQAAALNGHIATVKLLLACSKGSCHWSACYDAALETASFKGHLGIIHILLQNRPDTSVLEMLAIEGEKAMRAAVIAGQESVVKMLIKEIPQLRRIGRSFMVKCSFPGALDLLPPEPQTNAGGEIVFSYKQRYKTTASSMSNTANFKMINREFRSLGMSNQFPPKAQTDVRGEVSAKIKTATSGSIDVACTRPCNTTKYAFDWDSLTKRADTQVSTASPAQEVHSATPPGQEYLLRIAAGRGSKRMIERLMACGFELNETGNVNPNLSHQPTALDVAASKSDLEMVDLLLKRGAKLGNALDFAVRDGNVHVVCTLLAYSPEAELDCFVDSVELQEQYQSVQPISRRTMSNKSLLAIAVEWRHYEIILALLRRKAKSSHPGLGLSMIVAARNGDERTIRVLLEYGQATNGSLDKAIISDILLQQSFREASENGHLQIVKLLWDQCSLDNKRPQYICISMCEARRHGHDEIMVDLQALAQTLDNPRLLGDELITMASTRPAYDSQSQTWGSITPHLSTLLDQLTSRRVDSKLYVDLQLKALKGALKAGQYEAAHFLLGKDSSCCILKTETDILHFAIDAMWMNDFCNGQDWGYRNTRVHADLIETLIQHGASIGSYDSMGKTPLIYACSKPIPGVFDVLVKSKASPLSEHASSPSDNLESPISSPKDANAKKFNLLNVALISRLEHNGSRFYISHLEWEKIISTLLELGMSLHPNDPSLINYLHMACSQGDLKRVQQLVNDGADIHAAGHSQEKYFQLGTALHAAVIGGQVKVLQYLLDTGVNVRQKAVYQDPYNGDRLADETAIQIALHSTHRYVDSKDRWDVLKILLQVWDGMDDCTTALHAAIAFREVEALDLLLRRCTKVPDIQFCQDVEIIKLFISHGITIRAPPERMMESQKIAIWNTNVSLLELLVAQSHLLLPNPLSHVRILRYGEDQSHLDMLQFLVERNGCDTDATFQSQLPMLEEHYDTLGEQYDTNMLLEACKSRAEKTIHFLLEHGADPDGPGLTDTVLTRLFRKQQTPLYTQPTVRLLLDHGAEINGSKRCPKEAKKHPRTLQPPLIRAIEDQQPSMVEFLVLNGADVNATSGPETPLHLARRIGFDEIADFLMLHGAMDRYDTDVMGRRVWERPGLTPVTTESLLGHNKLRFP